MRGLATSSWGTFHPIKIFVDGGAGNNTLHLGGTKGVFAAVQTVMLGFQAITDGATTIHYADVEYIVDVDIAIDATVNFHG